MTLTRQQALEDKRWTFGVWYYQHHCTSWRGVKHYSGRGVCICGIVELSMWLCLPKLTLYMWPCLLSTSGNICWDFSCLANLVDRSFCLSLSVSKSKTISEPSCDVYSSPFYQGRLGICIYDHMVSKIVNT